MIRRARRVGREARGNEEREKREDEKGSHCFSSPQVGAQASKFGFFKLIECMKQNVKICVIGEQNVIN